MPHGSNTSADLRRQQLEPELIRLQTAMEQQAGGAMSKGCGPTFNPWPCQQPAPCGLPAQVRPPVGPPAASMEHPSSRPAAQDSMRSQPDLLSVSGGGHPNSSGSAPMHNVPITLPKLVEPSVKNATLAAGDWLAQLKPHISDICHGADRWWDHVLQAVETRYHHWLQADPLTRLHVVAITS